MQRALLVIDVQNEYVTGRLPISFPPLELSLANVRRAMDVSAEAGIPVVVVQQVAPASSPIFAAGGEGARLHETVSSRRPDLLLSKSLPSCFAGTELDEWLRSRDIDTVTIVGYMTQNCDESTARDAAHRGYRVEFLSDATGTLALANDAGAVDAKTLHETVCTVLHSRFAAVASTSEWCAAVAAGAPLPASNVYDSTSPARRETAGLA